MLAARVSCPDDQFYVALSQGGSLPWGFSAQFSGDITTTKFSSTAPIEITSSGNATLNVIHYNQRAFLKAVSFDTDNTDDVVMRLKTKSGLTASDIAAQVGPFLGHRSFMRTFHSCLIVTDWNVALQVRKEDTHFDSKTVPVDSAESQNVNLSALLGDGHVMDMIFLVRDVNPGDATAATIQNVQLEFCMEEFWPVLSESPKAYDGDGGFIKHKPTLHTSRHCWALSGPTKRF